VLQLHQIAFLVMNYKDVCGALTLKLAMMKTLLNVKENLNALNVLDIDIVTPVWILTDASGARVLLRTIVLKHALLLKP